jgi:hypothetical protein
MPKIRLQPIVLSGSKLLQFQFGKSKACLDASKEKGNAK